MTDFVMYIDDTEELARPVYNACTSDFWKRVRVRGFVASLTGDSRYNFQAGWWHIKDYGDDFHFEAMELRNIVGMSQEKSKTWRGG